MFKCISPFHMKEISRYMFLCSVLLLHVWLLDKQTYYSSVMFQTRTLGKLLGVEQINPTFSLVNQRHILNPCFYLSRRIWSIFVTVCLHVLTIKYTMNRLIPSTFSHAALPYMSNKTSFIIMTEWWWIEINGWCANRWWIRDGGVVQWLMSVHQAEDQVRFPRW